MSCAHCGFSCNKNGKHVDYYDVLEMIRFAKDVEGCESISIGGGEPTLHPRFFDILRNCLYNFEYVWMATNGSKYKVMDRLYNIIMQEDYPEDPEEYDDYDGIYQEKQLTVALSNDIYHTHTMVHDRIRRLWENSVERKYNGFELRDVVESKNGVISQGRAKKNQLSSYKGCVCPDMMIKNDGKIKMCGCSSSPIIGDIHNGIEKNWRDYMQKTKYQETNCYFGR